MNIPEVKVLRNNNEIFYLNKNLIFYKVTQYQSR